MNPDDAVPAGMQPPYMSRGAGPLTLDDTTATRLLDGQVDPADAPPGYATVATVLAAAAARRVGEPAGESAALAAFAHASTRSSTRRHSRAARLAALVVAGLVVLGGVAAATGSLPTPAQSVARDTLGSVGVAVPAPNQTAPTRTAGPSIVSPSTPPVHRAPIPPLAPSPPAAPPRPTPRVAPTPPSTTPRRPASPPIVVPACQAYEAGRLGPAGGRPAVAMSQALARLAGGAAQIASYCRTVLNG